MEQLLRDIITRLQSSLPYLHWIGALDDELLPPATVMPPFIGVKDGGLLSPSLPNQKDKETLTVLVIAYQSLNLGETGAAVLGSEAQLGDAGKGLLAVHADVRATLNDHLFDNRFYFAHREDLQASRVIGNDQRLLSMQRAIYQYRRISS